MSEPQPKPPEAKDYIPETRTWIMFGLFGLAFYVLHAIIQNPSLQDNKLFFGLATLIVGTFFGGAIGFYFGASQGGGKGVPGGTVSTATTIAATTDTTTS